MSTPKFLLAAAALGVSAASPARLPHVVLVHGAVMDGSGWRAVSDELRKQGVVVAVVQLPLTSLDDDVAATREVVDRQDGPVVLVGHSYGGAVITVAGTDPKVTSLVYVAALQPDVGESVADLNARWPMKSHPLALADNRMIVDPTAFRADVAADLPDDEAAFLAASQRPTAFAVFTAKLPVAAWRTKPSYAIVADQDRTLSPDMERFMYARSKARTTEVAASHAVYISRPREVAAVIMAAARS